MVAAAAVAAALYAASQLAELPQGREAALASIALFGMAGGAAYLGLLVVLRLMSVSDMVDSARALLRQAR